MDIEDMTVTVVADSDRSAGSARSGHQVAPVLGTGAPFLAIASVVFAPGFVRDGFTVSDQVQAQGIATAVTVALRK